MIKYFKEVATLPIIIIYLFTTLFSGVPFAYAENSDEQVFYYLHDHLGGIDAVVDENGNVVERKDYLPFGDDRQKIGDTDEDYGYTGKEEDNETGLYYYGARYYDPGIGRFAQIDPLVLDESEKPLSSVLGNPQALNGYSYVMNNPINYIDPLGEWGVLPGFGGYSHQILTWSALEQADVDEKWKEEHYKNLVNGSSIYADITVKFRGETDSSYHSTASPDVSSAFELKIQMMWNAKRFFDSDNDKEFGRLLHMVEDSFCPSHVSRDENGKIKAFFDYDKQDKSKHTYGDNIYNADFSLINSAVDATKTLIEFRANPDAKWEDVNKYLDKTVWVLDENASIGTAGEEYEDD